MGLDSAQRKVGGFQSRNEAKEEGDMGTGKEKVYQLLKTYLRELRFEQGGVLPRPGQDGRS